MTAVTITEAARLTGKSAKTLYRWASHGRLSTSRDTNGMRVVDTSELMRVCGELRISDVSHEKDNDNTMRTHVTDLETQVRELRAALAAKEQIIETQTRNLDDLRQALKLLEAPKKRRWWLFK